MALKYNRWKNSVAATAIFIAGLGTSSVIWAQDAPTEAAQSIEQQVDTLVANRDYDGAIAVLYALEEAGEATSDTFVRIAEIYLEAGNGIAAESSIDRARRRGADYAATVIVYAKALLMQGKFNAAVNSMNGIALREEDRADAYVIVGDAQFANGKLAEAINNYEQALTHDTVKVEALLGLARLAMRNNDLAGALSYVQSAETAHPDNSMVHYTKGLILRYQGNSGSAQVAFLKALELFPENIMANIELAGMSLGAGDVEAAETFLDNVYTVSDSNPMALFLSAVIAAKEGRFEEAEALLVRVPSVTEQYLPGIYVRGLVAYQMGNYTIAVQHLDTVLKARPAFAPARQVMAATRLQMGEASQAYNILAPMVSNLETADAVALTLAGSAASALGRTNDAERYFSAARSKGFDGGSENLKSLTTKLALAQFADGNDEDALQTLREHLENQEKAIRELGILASLQIRSGDLNDAEETARSIISNAPDRALGHNVLGSVLMQKGELLDAKFAFDRAITLNSDYHTALRNRGLTYLRMRQYAEAETDLRRLLRQTPNDARGKAMLAKVLMNKEEYDEAADLFAAARRDLRPSADLEVDYADALSKAGRTFGAIDTARKSMKYAKDRPDLLKRLGEILIFTGKPEMAASILSRYVAFDPSNPEANLLYSRSLYRSGLFAGARFAFKRALQFTNDSQAKIIDWYLFAIDVQTGEYTNAVSALNSLDKSARPDDVDVGLEGYAHIENGDYEAAISAFKEALDINDTARTRIGLAEVYVQMDNPEEAVDTLNEFLSSSPQERSVRIKLAEIFIEEERFRDAANSFEQILDAGLADARVSARLALVYLQLGDNKSVAVAERARVIMPEDPFILNAYGWVMLQAARDVGKALPALEKASRREPGNAVYKFRYGMGLLADGQKSVAENVLGQALGISETFEGAEEARRILGTR